MKELPKVKIGYFASAYNKAEKLSKEAISKLFRDIRNFDGPPPVVHRLKAKCKHKNVIIRSVHAITLQPKRGVCKDCGEWVKAKIVWVDK